LTKAVAVSRFQAFEKLLNLSHRLVAAKSLVTLEFRDADPDVLVITNGWPHEEDETYCVFIKRQTESLAARGLRCDVLFIRGYRSRLAYLIAAARLARWSCADSHRYALVHAHGGEAAVAAVFYWRCPLLVSYLGDDLLGTANVDGSMSVAHRIRRTIIRQQSRLAARTITKSTEMERALPRSVRARNTVVPNGVDAVLFRPQDRNAARRELGWSRDERVVLFLANPQIVCKRYWLAERAVQRARLSLPALRFQVAFAVAPDRIPSLMNAADCLLLTSSSEGSPNVVKEALMCNLPVVATRAGDVVELLDAIEPSYVCDDSEAALAEAILACITVPRRSNGRALSRRLDSQVVSHRLLGIYGEIAPSVKASAEAPRDSYSKVGIPVRNRSRERRQGHEIRAAAQRNASALPGS
jgi:glycosyltransferase involved in cell wall biosynthesis